MDVGAAFVADHEALHLVQPGVRALDHPAVPSEPLARLDHRSSDATQDAARPEGALVLARVVRLVAVELLGPATWPALLAAHRWDGVEEFGEERDLVDVGCRDELGERDAAGVAKKMALRARFSTIRRIRPGLAAPFFAGTDEASTAARLQSICSASRRRLSNSCCNRFQTPASCQSRRRRQQVMPEPEPSSWGRYSHGSPVRSTKSMPARHLLSTIGLRRFDRQEWLNDLPQLV